jgi:four helix bundle protein
MAFEVYEVARELQRELRAIEPIVRRRDKDLADQLRRAGQSVVLNIGEGNLSGGGHKRARFETAMGSANEVTCALHAAVDWGYVGETQTKAAEELADRVRAMLWRLTRGAR